MIIDEDYIQNDGLIAENEHLHKIVTEQDKEIERLKDVIKNKHLKEIERLNNIINELEKYFFEQLQIYGGGGTAQEYYDKLQELKGSDKE